MNLYNSSTFKFIMWSKIDNALNYFLYKRSVLKSPVCHFFS